MDEQKFTKEHFTFAQALFFHLKALFNIVSTMTTRKCLANRLTVVMAVMFNNRVFVVPESPSKRVAKRKLRFREHKKL